MWQNKLISNLIKYLKAILYIKKRYQILKSDIKYMAKNGKILFV